MPPCQEQLAAFTVLFKVPWLLHLSPMLCPRAPQCHGEFSAHPLCLWQDGGSAAGGTIVLSDGVSVPYDWLVLALGAETNTFGIPGVKELALPFATYEDALKVRGWMAFISLVLEGGRECVCCVGGTGQLDVWLR